MQFTKQTLVSMNRCYSVAAMNVRGETKIFYATEGEGPCVAFSGPDLSHQETVWEGPGGTMSMVPIPGTNGDFLAVQRFFRLFQWDEACLVRVCASDGGGWNVNTLFTMPYLHRFDILRGKDGATHLIACTLAESKETREDWSKPGSVYVAPLSGDWGAPLELAVVKNDIFQNHGYCRVQTNGEDRALFAGREGVFMATPPENANGEWRLEHVLDVAASDMALADIDGDGELEIAVIEGFHGNTFRIYKKINGAYQPIYEHGDHSDFYHVVWGGSLAGRQAFIGGCRRGSQDLFTLHWENGRVVYTCVEAGVGPSNVAVLHAAPDNAHITGGRDIIIAANREIAEGAVYFVAAD